MEIKQEEVQKIERGSVVLFPDQGYVAINGKQIHLTKTEAKILGYLMTNSHMYVSDQKILDYVYGVGAFSYESANVRVYIGYIKKKLGKDYITVQRGFGHRFVLPNSESYE